MPEWEPTPAVNTEPTSARRYARVIGRRQVRWSDQNAWRIR